MYLSKREGEEAARTMTSHNAVSRRGGFATQGPDRTSRNGSGGEKIERARAQMAEQRNASRTTGPAQ